MRTTPGSNREPLERFLELARAFSSDRTLFDDTELWRWAAVALAQSSGEPLELAREVRATTAELRKRAKWWRDPVGGARAFVAGVLVNERTSVDSFMAELERVVARLRELKVPRNGVADALTTLMLRDQADDGRVQDAHLRRLAELYRRVKRDHSLLLGAGDLTTLAVAATADEQIETIGGRLESIYADLRARGFALSSALVGVSHVLYHHPAPDRRACEKFDALWKQFKARKLYMHSGDYDEVALLTLLPDSNDKVVDSVLAHRKRIDELRPKPGRDASFSFACATTFLTLSARGRRESRLSRLQAAFQVRAVIVARQAATMAAAGATAV